MKFTYKQWEEFTYTQHYDNDPIYEEFEKEIKEKQKRCRERTLDIYDIKYEVKKLLKNLDGMISRKNRAGMAVTISPNFGQAYGKSARNRAFIETQIYIVFNEKGFDIRLYRETPESKFYSYYFASNEQKDILYSKVFEKYFSNKF